MMLHDAAWPIRLIGNYLYYRRMLPRAGRWAAVRWAWNEPRLPYTLRK